MLFRTRLFFATLVCFVHGALCATHAAISVSEATGDLLVNPSQPGAAVLLDGVDVVQEVADARTLLSGVVAEQQRQQLLAAEEDVATRITKLTDDFSKMTGDLAAAAVRIGAEETKSTDAKTELDAANQKISKLEDDVKEAAQLTADVDAANQKISKLEDDVKEAAQLTADVAKLKEQILAVDNHPRAALYFEIDRNTNTCKGCSFAYHWTSESYFAAEVVITMGQSNGGAENNLYIRGIWHQNHVSHNWEELEHVGGIGALTKVAITATDKDGNLGTNSNTGRLALELDYSQSSFLGGRVMIRPFWFASLVSSKKFGWKETPKPILGTTKDQPATTCKEIKEKAKSAQSGIYWLKPKDDENAFATHCEMTEDGGGWSVVLKFGDTKDQIPGFFNNYMEGGRLYTAGDCAENHPSSRYTRRFPKAMFTEVAVLCVDSKFKNVNDWIGTAFIDGTPGLDWSKRQQTNTFGMTDNSETLFHSSASNFVEFNIIDNSDQHSTSSAMTGYGLWRGAQTGGCGILRAAVNNPRGNNDNPEHNTKISRENQLVLMVR